MNSYQREIELSLKSCIISRKDGVPLNELNNDFKMLTGYSVPYLSLGHSSLIDFLAQLEDIYFIKDNCNNDIVIVESKKSNYMKKLVEKQRPLKRKRDLSFNDSTTDFNYTSCSAPSTISSYCSYSNKNTYFPKTKKRKPALMEKEIMDTLTPVIYGHQLMGDDIFLEIVEHRLMATINKSAPKRCGLCMSGQTISDLIENIDLQVVLPSRAAVLVGLIDLLNGKTSEEMIENMNNLISNLKELNIITTLFTIPRINCIPKYLYPILETFNKFIISQEDSDSITVMNLDEYYKWMVNEKRPHKVNENLLSSDERDEILCGLSNFLNREDNEE